jgi:hypothetical protein
LAWVGALALVPTTIVLTGGASGCGYSTIDYCHPSEGVPAPGCGGGGAGTGITCGPGTVLRGKECVVASDDAGDDAADAPSALACTGQCAPYSPLEWSGPSLLWIGPPSQTPTCPAAVSASGYFAYADLDASAPCPPCQCAPPAGSCGLPPAIGVSPESCEAADADGGDTPFNPPAGWDGGCTEDDAIAGGALCDGGPCAQSATIAPLTVNETGCEPVAPTVSPPPISQSSALICEGMAPGACAITGESCLPATPGFAICVFQAGDHDCSASFGPYTQKVLVYIDVSGMPSCSACTCGAPAGSVCTSKLSFYVDGMCASPASNANLVDSTKPVCVDLITGTALGSKSASEPVYAPGACQAGGGVLMGSVVPVDPTTFCCIQPPVPPPFPEGTARP